VKRVGFLILLILVIGNSGSYDSEINNSTYNPQTEDTYSIGADGEEIILVNNCNATDKTYNEVIQFIKTDKTDEKPYILESYTCGDYAEEVHNNAEAAGIKAGWVTIEFKEGGIGHAFNVFNTTDSGLIYIDCTGWDGESRDISVGSAYSPIIPGNPDDWEYTSMGIISEYDIYW